jgi:TRAP-type C4-dicarboxylate transport system permease small subunit
MQTITKIVRKLSVFLAAIGGIITAIMMFLTVGDVLGRRFLHMPIPGTFEITKIGLVFIVTLGLAYAEIEGENLGISILYDKFPRIVRHVLRVLTYLVSTVLFSLVFYNTVLYAARVAANKQITSVLRLPVAPWIYISAIGVGALALILLYELIDSVINFNKGEMADES